MSVVDHREIQFTAEAVRRVICASPRAARAMGLPGSQPNNIQFIPSDGLVRVTYSNGLRDEEIAISAEHFGALLVSYCLRIGIPMPKSAQKEVCIEDNCISLLFTTVYSDGMLSGGGTPGPANPLPSTASAPN